MVSRADRYTTRQTSSNYFSDFYNKFKKNPKSGMLDRITNEDSIRQAIKNLILTNLGERLYQPTVGGDVNAHLFEMCDRFAANDLEQSIAFTIQNNEKRVSQLSVSVTPVPEQNEFKVNIIFTILNNEKTENLELTLQRVR